MFLIFVLSAQGGLSAHEDPPLWFYVERKGAHIFEYFVLAFLAFRFFRDVYAGESVKRVMLLAALFALAYAVTDELHQTFVPGREGRMTDVLIDGIGISLFACWYYLWRRYGHKISKNQ
jgi:VanZ family protein